MNYDCTNHIDKRKDYIEEICYGYIVEKSPGILDMYLVCKMKDYYWSDEALHLGRFWLEYPEGEVIQVNGKKKDYKTFKPWINSIFKYKEDLMVFNYFEALKLSNMYKRGKFKSEENTIIRLKK